MNTEQQVFENIEENVLGAPFNKYSDSKIYKLTSPNIDQIYIGSTTQTLNRRLRGHINDYHYYVLGRKSNHTAAQLLLSLGAVKIELIENVNCSTRKELLIREQYYLDQFRGSCVNENYAYRPQKQYQEDNKELIQIQKNRWYNNNRDEIIEANLKYYYDNRNTILNKRNTYYKKLMATQPDKLAKYNREYRIKNRDKIYEKKSALILCECGREITVGNKYMHNKSKIHTQLINASSVQDYS